MQDRRRGLWSRLVSWRAAKTGSEHPRDPALRELWMRPGEGLAGVDVTADTAMQVSGVYSCVGLLADTVATLPIGVSRRLEDDTSEPARDHPVHRLLSVRPNRWHTPVEYTQLCMTHLALRGNAYSQIVPNNAGEITELVPLHPDRTDPFLAPDGNVAYRHTPTNGPRRVFLHNEVVHLRRRPFDHDGLKGLSPIQLHRETIGLAMAATRYGAAFFGNSATPRTAVKVDQVISKEAKSSLIKDWEQRFKGIENAHKLVVLDGGMEMQKLGITNEDAQFLQTRGFQLADICRIYGIPPFLAGDQERATSWGTGLEQQSTAFVKFFLRPWVVLFEQNYDWSLFSERDRLMFFVRINIDGLMRGDFKGRMDGYKTLVMSAVGTPNDVRKLENMPPATDAGADSRLVPLNMAPAEHHLDILMKNGPTQTPAGEGETEEPQNDNAN